MLHLGIQHVLRVFILQLLLTVVLVDRILIHEALGPVDGDGEKGQSMVMERIEPKAWRRTPSVLPGEEPAGKTNSIPTISRPSESVQGHIEAMGFQMEEIEV